MAKTAICWLSEFYRRQDTMQLGLEISNKGSWITGFIEDQ